MTCTVSSPRCTVRISKPPVGRRRVRRSCTCVAATVRITSRSGSPGGTSVRRPEPAGVEHRVLDPAPGLGEVVVPVVVVVAPRPGRGDGVAQRARQLRVLAADDQAVEDGADHDEAGHQQPGRLQADPPGRTPQVGVRAERAPAHAVARAELVAEPADRADRVAAELAPQVVHVGVDDAVVLRVGEHLGHQLVAAEHPAGPPRQHRQQRALALRDVAGLAGGVHHGPGGDHQPPARDGQGVGHVAVAAQQRPDPREQLVDVERLGQVVLRPRVQPVDPVPRQTQRRQHQHRGRDPAGAQPAEQVQPLDRRQAPVEDHRVVRAGEAQVQPGLPVAGQVDDVARRDEDLLEHGGQRPVVLDQQQPSRVRRPDRLAPGHRIDLHPHRMPWVTRSATRLPRRRCARSGPPRPATRPRATVATTAPATTSQRGKDHIRGRVAASCGHSTGARRRAGRSPRAAARRRGGCASRSGPCCGSVCSSDSPDDVVIGTRTRARAAAAAGPHDAQRRNRGQNVASSTASAAVGTTTTVACTISGWRGRPKTVTVELLLDGLRTGSAQLIRGFLEHPLTRHPGGPADSPTSKKRLVQFSSSGSTRRGSTMQDELDEPQRVPLGTGGAAGPPRPSPPSRDAAPGARSSRCS